MTILDAAIATEATVCALQQEDVEDGKVQGTRADFVEISPTARSANVRAATTSADLGAGIGGAGPSATGKAVGNGHESDGSSLGDMIVPKKRRRATVDLQRTKCKEC